MRNSAKSQHYLNHRMGRGGERKLSGETCGDSCKTAKNAVIPECLYRESRFFRRKVKDWIPAFAGMTTFATVPCLAVALFFFAVSCKPTYQKGKFEDAIKDLARKEYQLEVEAQQVGETLGLRYPVKNLLAEMFSGDETIYKQMNGLFLILVRVGLSADVPPRFVVLEIVDEVNPEFKIVFTRYMEDVRKSMAEALSFTQSQDRLLQEIVIGEKRFPFDAEEMDMVRLMMLAMDAPASAGALPIFQPADVRFPQFLADVAANQLRRVLREKKEIKQDLMLRQVSTTFDEGKERSGQFRILIDLVSRPSARVPPSLLEEKVLPLAAKEVSELFKSYKYRGFGLITVIEKNSGKMLSVPVK